MVMKGRYAHLNIVHIFMWLSWECDVHYVTCDIIVRAQCGVMFCGVEGTGTGSCEATVWLLPIIHLTAVQPWTHSHFDCVPDNPVLLTRYPYLFALLTYTYNKRMCLCSEYDSFPITCIYLLVTNSICGTEAPELRRYLGGLPTQWYFDGLLTTAKVVYFFLSAYVLAAIDQIRECTPTQRISYRTWFPT